MLMKDDVYDACCWGSHLPALLGCLADTVGPVLELGIGHFSTPALHAFCVQANRQLTSIEQDRKWVNQFAKYRCKEHQILCGEYDDVLASLEKHSWSVVLIDNSPGGKRRADDFRTLIQKAIYVVVHDFHLENSEAIGPFLTNGINSHITTSYQPPTLVAARTRTIPMSIRCL